jgi:hypothetical protein
VFGEKILSRGGGSFGENVENNIFLLALYSLYTQIPGLYGENGLLPVENQAREIDNNAALNNPGMFCEQIVLSNPSSSINLFYYIFRLI